MHLFDRWRSRRLVAAAAALAACTPAPAPVYQGYAEGEFALIASPFAGTLETLAVARGGQVRAGDALFALEKENETAARQEALERLRSAQAGLANLTGTRRPPEVAASRAQVAQAEAMRKYLAQQSRRYTELERVGFISRERLDELLAQLDQQAAAVAEREAQARLARESIGRNQELSAAKADIDAARAVLAQAQWKLDQKAQRAPAAGLVHDTYFVPGEWVPAGKPVVSLLPPGNIKVRFFVPEPVAGTLDLGQQVEVRCDSCGGAIPASISYISPRAEFTPPVIYSRETRSKLVFMVEARPVPEQATRLKLGQPLDVSLVRK
jgi:HlyD family secretion protein